MKYRRMLSAIPSCSIHQIFYDAATRAALAPNVVPLDNTGPCDGWFEFRPILEFLRSRDLEPTTYYGFLSPRFEAKTGIRPGDIPRYLTRAPDCDALLLSSDQVSLTRWRNVWIQGETAHPGLIDAAETFLATLGPRPDLLRDISHLRTSVFSNYIVARPAFWRRWQAIAEAYLSFVENDPAGMRHCEPVRYTHGRGYPLKAFVQERLAARVLSEGQFDVAHPLTPATRRFLGPADSQVLLQADRMKRHAATSGQESLILLHRLLGRRLRARLETKRRPPRIAPATLGQRQLG